MPLNLLITIRYNEFRQGGESTITDTMKAEIFALFMIALGALVLAFVAFCNRWKRQWDSDIAEAKVDRKEIKENARRAANGSHVTYDKREGDPPKEQSP